MTLLTKNSLRLGFGCSGVWGKPWFAEAKAHRVLRKAIENGVSHIDTAGFYGEAEERLGRLLRDIQAPLFISSKTGTIHTPRGPVKDFSPVAITSDVERSLKRLGRERLDLLYLHGPDDRQMEEAAPTLTRLKQAGKIACAGVCGEGVFLDQAADTEFVDVIMGAYNFLRREHGPVFARAKQNGKAVVAIAPLAQGLYRKGFYAPRTPGDVWHLARALFKNREELKKARARAHVLAEPGWTPAGLALGFVLADPAIDVAVTSTTRLRHLDETLAAARQPMPRAALERLSALAGETPEGAGA